MWDVAVAGARQVRVAAVATRDGIRLIPTGLDFAAVLAVGTARGVDLDMLADVLPAVETAVLAAHDEDD